MAIKMKLTSEEYEKLGALPNAVESLTGYVGVKDDVAAAIFEAAGIEGTDDFSSIAFLLDDEWETLIKELRVNGGPIPLGVKSRVRKLLLISRIMMDAAEGPPTGADEDDGGLHPART